MKTKRPVYSQAIARIDSAIQQEFYFEASWIEYSIFEDRINSYLEKTGGKLNNPRASIEAKLVELENRSKSHDGLKRIPGFPSLFNEVRQWKNRRNPLMHRMVDIPTSWDNINNDARDLAIKGRELLGRFNSAGMKLRDWVVRQKSNS